MDGKFDSILLDRDISKNLGVNYANDVTPTDEEYDKIIVEKRPNDDDEVIDNYLNMNLIFDVGTNDECRGTMVKRSWGLDGRVISFPHNDPFFETREYKIYLTDGTRDKYTANLITENMYVQVDDKGHQFQLLGEIQDHSKDGMAI